MPRIPNTPVYERIPVFQGCPYPHVCPQCGRRALIEVPDAFLPQRDRTNVVCSPAFGGCDVGFQASLPFEFDDAQAQSVSPIRVIALYHAMRLELRTGMKHSRGVNPFAIARAEFGIQPRTKAKVCAAFREMFADILRGTKETP